MLGSQVLYPAIFHKEETGYSVRIPDLVGCFTESDTLEEAFDMAFDAVGLYLTDILDRKENIPQPSDPSTFDIEKNEFVVLIKFDFLAYRKKHDTRAIKKTLTIPSWLNQVAEDQNINFSGVLQDALLKKLNLNADETR